MEELSLQSAAREKPLSSDFIKYIAAAAMLIDHIAWCFVDTCSFLGQIMHVIGRITAPIMCYFVSEGYHYTRDLKKYMLRMGIFAVISWFPFVYMGNGTIYLEGIKGLWTINPMQSVLFTFFLGLCALAVVHDEKNLFCSAALPYY